jgi:hypothetical protein
MRSRDYSHCNKREWGGFVRLSNLFGVFMSHTPHVSFTLSSTTFYFFVVFSRLVFCSLSPPPPPPDNAWVRDICFNP